jgi:hypothetical protein
LQSNRINDAHLNQLSFLLGFCNILQKTIVIVMFILSFFLGFCNILQKPIVIIMFLLFSFFFILRNYLKRSVAFAV